MDAKLTVFLVLVILGLIVDHSSADFFYNRPSPKKKDLEKLDLKCVPGRTVMNVQEKAADIKKMGSDSSNEFTRKQNTVADYEEGCTICVCNAHGTEEFCFKRPSGTLNECMMIGNLLSERGHSDPYDYERSLFHRIRRDLIWHNDEIPYDPSSKCYRGHSYYTNHETPNDTDINYKEEVISLLDFQSETSCYFCVCSVSGFEVECISRNVWFCNYLRYLRSDRTPRDMYASLFKQDRPAYFRQLSHRVRRVMDDSLFNLIEHVNSRRSSRRHLELPQQCVPYVSQYSDCNAFNQCEKGCTKCVCTMGGYWDCQSVKLCNEYDEDEIDDEMFENAMQKLDFDMKKLKEDQQKYVPSLNHLLSGINKSEQPIDIVAKNRDTEMRSNEDQKPPAVNTGHAPRPPHQRKPEGEEELGDMRYNDPIDNIKRYLSRQKRSLAKKNADIKHKRSTEKTSNKRLPRNSNKENNTIKFYSTVDELNEDTLKHSNVSGTLAAKRINLNVLPDKSRRSNIMDKNNTSLQIDYNHPQALNHISDNKIDLDHDNKYDLSHEKLNALLGNHTQQNKDKELSKLVVNELKPGSEIVGDSKAPVTSNITFTSENDTLTAMAYIAGNLLNKLWSMEKDTSGSTLETEDMKHEKISDLLDLFKEPLNLRQETFLKNVLERLSNAIDTDKDIKNGTICQTIEEAKSLIDNYEKPNDDDGSNVLSKQEVPCKKSKAKDILKVNQYATAKAISKINNVLGLLRKFEDIQANLSYAKNEPEPRMKNLVNITQPITKKLVIDTVLSKNEANSLNMFGNLLDKITKVLLPKQNSGKVSSSIKQRNVFNNDLNFRNNYMKMFNKDISNMSVTEKDKIVLDYITHINNNPDCRLNQNHEAKSLPTIEGNILLNLSEFFKMKSIADLINLVEPTKALNNNTKVRPSTTTIKPVESTTIRDQATTKSLRVSSPQKFASTKEKLKAHLKTIIEDLIELQDAKGIHSRGNIRIADALPCIYNIMNAGKAVLKKENEEHVSPDNIVDMFNELRIDMRRMQTRRSDSIMTVRPKSAVVLERVIKSLSEKAKPQTRRLLYSKDFKPFDKVSKTINNLSNISSNYKNQALYSEVPPTERIVLLKAFQQEVRSYISALQGIKTEFKNLSKMPVEKFAQLAAFILSSAGNITLDGKVIQKLEKVQVRKHTIDTVPSNNNRIINKIQQQPYNTLNAYNDDNNNNNELKVTRHQIINHLIRKRIQMYMKMKEAKEFDVNTNMNYNIAKRALFYLDSGNYNLAHELFKILMMQNEGRQGTDEHILNLASPAMMPASNPVYQHIQHTPRQLHPVPFEEPKILDNEMNYKSQDHLIKQLLNIKNMGI